MAITYKSYEVRILTENSAFEDAGELARILRELADKLDANPRASRERIALFDINGNKCGHAAPSAVGV